ncbi:MAG: 8-amino-7-oxononanoate synthase [Sulfuricaulis sp.]|uniref:8-amino-7-oxononanoate synthase n=1 Tax=Sulfuricaulis sp. TaxID=2003553 RepID=UPI0025E57BFD|nr:8-amino-7-oxononanoate synthase [Sulfuricaulis sp.]MCR4346846.1 8-amino-7-oxononanoate synthase [Sulfuricaulis sp.]
MKPLEDDLSRRHEQKLYRERLVLESPQGAEVRVGENLLLSFCSNDYLGLANDPRVIRAFQQGAERYGVGAGASHLVSGHSRAHHALEEELADFVGAERALLFSTGYMANLGVMSALTDRNDAIFEDRLNHASLIDAARLARAKVTRFPHADVHRLADMLAHAPRPQLITTDAVFSMDGDIAPLAELSDLAVKHDTRLLVDDAHGLGVLGQNGRGTLEHLDLPLVSPVILMGTLGKALGVFGAFVAGEEVLIETLIQRARTYIYTTALPPAVAEAVRASLRIVQEEGWRRERLRTLVAQFRSGAERLGLVLLPSPTPIQPVVLGTVEAALRASQHLREQGILVPAIRPPTVLEGSSRLRITFSAAHEEAHVDRLLEALSAVRI